MTFRKLITTQTEHDAAIRRMVELLDANPAPDSPDAQEVELISLLTREFSARMTPLPSVKSSELLAFLMAENELKQRDLAPLIGDKTQVSAVLAGRRRLTPAACAKLKKRFAVDFAAIVGREVMEAPSRRVRRPALKTSRAKRPERKA